MKIDAEEQKLLRQYLLGTLDEDGQGQIEERLLNDREFAEEVAIAETELIDDYVSGALSEQEQKVFDAHVLSTPEGVERLQFARTLEKYWVADTVPSPKPLGFIHQIASWPRRFLLFLRSQNRKIVLPLAGALSLLIAASYVTWVILKNRQVNQVSTQRALLEEELAKLNQQNSTLESAANTLSVTLQPILVRDVKGSGRIVIPAKDSIVQLRLALAADKYQSYLATLQTAEGSEIATVKNLKAMTVDNSKLVILKITGSTLSPGDYQIKLGGVTTKGEPEEIGIYPLPIVNDY